MRFTLKQLFPGSTDFTEAIFKIPQISKHFLAMLNRVTRSVLGNTKLDLFRTARAGEVRA